MLLKPIETPETLGQGKILLTLATREALTTHQMQVVCVGKLPYCEDPECERPHSGNQHLTELKAGDWVLVRHRSLLETHQEGLYCAHQDDILAVLQA